MKNTEVILVVPGTTKTVETPFPQPKENEVLIQVEYCLLYTSQVVLLCGLNQTVNHSAGLGPGRGIGE